MNAELIKALRKCGKASADRCWSCDYYDREPWCESALANDAADAIEELVSGMPKWIDANERLPEQTGEYIVFRKASKKRIDAGEDVSYTTAMWFFKEKKIWKEMNGDDSYNAVLSAVDTDWSCSVTHWMPLPDAPEVEG